MRTFLPPNAQVAGPVDMLGNTDADSYLKSLSAVFADPDNDGVLAIMVPHLLVHPVAVIEAMEQRGCVRVATQADRGLLDGRRQSEGSLRRRSPT